MTAFGTAPAIADNKVYPAGTASASILLGTVARRFRRRFDM